MDNKVSDVRDFLIQIARRRRLTNYTDAGAVVGLEMASEVGRIQIAQILDEINAQELSRGAPMLSALVIYQDRKRPGPGFFTCAKGLGKLRDNDEDGFWAREVAAVHVWWASH
ncbi:MAG: hypothetical protein Q7T04_04890 [Dehalococcoidia bacterium]|nr:hypothetical protein [Dehalococcoidia bacterium]